ncbi:MAG TPA: malto-oligosyltrehalose synthase [Burkholderiaceae bacterium]|nr:malto-oligosyltrehalose synthase [Burkholderiaceae bacterium]
MSTQTPQAQQARSTLRLQLHASYSMDDACRDIAYFSRLGVTHLYLSPITRSRDGSTHGYDVIDHTQVDEARGGEAALRRLASLARQHGLGLLLDIVPNHMATDPDNAWWWDVLKHGRGSRFARWFDIDWEAEGAQGRVLAPFLGKPYEQSLREGDIRLSHDAGRGLHIAVNGQPWPLAPESLAWPNMQEGPGGSPALQACLAAFDPASAGGRARLHELLARQHYQLAWWRQAARAINWRRFFEVSELIGVRVEEDEVFDAVHELPLRLYAEGLIDGLRIDHVDGLAQPLAYCRKLHEAMETAGRQRPEGLAAKPWIVIEKILAPGETLDERWMVSGTTGYDFAADVGALLHDAAGEAALTSLWADISGDARPAKGWLLEARQEMLDRHFIAERRALLRALQAQEGSDTDLEPALDALLRHFPTYRSYVEEGTRSASDQVWFDQAREGAAAELVATGQGAALERLQWLDATLGGQVENRAAANLAIQRFQQLTPPLAAKSLEDTVFYRYGRMLSRNEVGSDPALFALPIDAFHEANVFRARRMEDGLLATATHDHKRGEDARARLAVLSEAPENWSAHCQRWMQAGAPHVPGGNEAAAFHYMLLQTLVAAWPPMLSATDRRGVEHLLERVQACAVKALREGKLLSSWFEPQEDHEALWLNWLQLLAPGKEQHGVLVEIADFVHKLEPAAIFNSLVQTTLRLTCPGVPDLYQGTEWRDFSLVDPDNRRPVDYAARARALNLLDQALLDGERVVAPLAPGAWPAQAWVDGRVKQALVATLLALRKSRPAAFCGDYQTLQVDGGWAQQVVAFARGGDVVVVAAVKCASATQLGSDGAPFVPSETWDGSGVELPGGSASWWDVLRRRSVQTVNGKTPLKPLLDGLPIAVLLRAQG